MKHLFSCAAFASILAGAAMADGTTLTTFTGPVEVAETPETVITFDVGVLDTLLELGVKVDGITQPIYIPAHEHLADKDITNIGSLFEPKFEQVFAMKPDLIIAGPRTRDQLEPLSKIAPTVDLSAFSTDIDEVVTTHATELGKLFGKEEIAQEKVNHLHASLAELHALTKDAGNALIVMTNGPKISVFGPGSRFGWVHETFGIEPRFEDVKAETHGEAISFEFLHDADPDWLIVFDRTKATKGDGPLASETLNNELVAETTAMKKGQVIYVHPADFYIATTGLRSLQSTTDQFIDAFKAAQ